MFSMVANGTLPGRKYICNPSSMGDGGTSSLFPWYGIIRWHPPTRGYQLTFLYVGVFGVPAHFLIYGKDTGFLFVIGCSR